VHYEAGCSARKVVQLETKASRGASLFAAHHSAMRLEQDPFGWEGHTAFLLAQVQPCLLHITAMRFEQHPFGWRSF